MIFVHVGKRLVRTKDLRFDSFRTVHEDDAVEAATDHEARVRRKEEEIQEELKHQKPNKFGLI